MKISVFELDSDGYRIPCKLYEPEETPDFVVVGVHGFAGDKESSVLSKLAGALCARQAALLCFDFPAHGSSKAEDHLLRVDNCKADLIKVMQFAKEKFPCCRYGIFATSFGGYITLLCSGQIKGWDIVLRAPAVTMAETFMRSIVATPEDVFFQNGGALCGFERKMFVSSDFYRDLLLHPVSVPSQPLLIIHGTADDIVPYHAVKQLCESHPNVTLAAIIGADHRFKRPGEVELIIAKAMHWYFR